MSTLMSTPPYVPYQAYKVRLLYIFLPHLTEFTAKKAKEAFSDLFQASVCLVRSFVAAAANFPPGLSSRPTCNTNPTAPSRNRQERRSQWIARHNGTSTLGFARVSLDPSTDPAFVFRSHYRNCTGGEKNGLFVFSIPGHARHNISVDISFRNGVRLETYSVLEHQLVPGFNTYPENVDVSSRPFTRCTDTYCSLSSEPRSNLPAITDLRFKQAA
jgi:hypothetical protein